MILHYSKGIRVQGLNRNKIQAINFAKCRVA